MFKFTNEPLENNNEENVEFIAAPLEGELIAITEVPDALFSQKALGNGFAIIPSSGIVVSPINGVVTTIFTTKHAIGLSTEGGDEILIHVGLETANLKGEGFEVKVKEWEKVKVGDTLLTFDMDRIKDKISSLITPVIFPNLKEGKSLIIRKSERVSLGEKKIAMIK